MQKPGHVVWIAFAAAVGFGTAWIFGDLLVLPLDLYYSIYFVLIAVFFAVYIRRTQLDLKALFSRGLLWGLVLGLVFAALMVKNVLAQPATAHASGPALVGQILWRGLAYGVVDGLLLSVFPWIVTWRAFRVAEKPWPRQLAYGLLAWVFILVVTTSYHLGYGDFRSRKIIQPNIGNTLISLPTLLSSSPVGAPLTHAAMHIAAVVHCPETDLFLPPHR